MNIQWSWFPNPKAWNKPGQIDMPLKSISQLNIVQENVNIVFNTVDLNFLAYMKKLCLLLFQQFKPHGSLFPLIIPSAELYTNKCKIMHLKM